MEVISGFCDGVIVELLLKIFSRNALFPMRCIFSSSRASLLGVGNSSLVLVYLLGVGARVLGDPQRFCRWLSTHSCGGSGWLTSESLVMSGTFSLNGLVPKNGSAASTWVCLSLVIAFEI